MSHQHSGDPIVTLFEGDQSALYSGVYNQHRTESINSDASKAKIKKIWMITLYLAIITIVEISLGLWDHHTEIFNRMFLNIIFLALTVLKAALIVGVFMHLGDEFRNFIMAVLIPMILVIWIISSFLGDGAPALKMNKTQANTKKAQTEQVVKPAPQKAP